ncbi:MAG: AzlC family protein [Clostridia bacterium]|nr:AzlC family protein [Clostridia bacterium]
MAKWDKEEYKRGLKKGLPIGLGYLYVSVAFGMMAAAGGLSPISALVISMTNLTSAGQFAGIGLIFNSAAYIEIALTVFIINIRYFLMSLALSQKLSVSMGRFKKMIIAFGITDEIFTMASLEKQPLSYEFMLGLISLPYIGWGLGTYLGAATTMLFPPLMQDALGIALYAMFIAIIVPAIRESRAVLVTTGIAVSLSCVFKYAPYLKDISSGFAVIIATLIAAGTAAYLFPIKEES